jgi:hypothetical protein
MSQKLPILKLTKSDRLWLKELYEHNYEGNRITLDMWGKLHHQLPPYYRPERMDSHLIRSTFTIQS